MIQSKTYFVSDVHLGAPAMNNNRQREERFVRWLDLIGQDAKTLYLLGDIFDFWYEYRKVAPRGFVRTLGKLAELSDRGIEINYFTGNHDLWITDYLPLEIGLQVFREPVVRSIDGKQFFLSHGDGLDPSEKGYLALKRLFTSKTARFFFTSLHPNLAFWFGHQWAKKSRLAKGTEPEVSRGPEFETNVQFARHYLKTNPVHFFVMGHRHLLMDEPVGDDSRIVMLGEWFNYYSYAVFDGQKLELKTFL